MALKKLVDFLENGDGGGGVNIRSMTRGGVGCLAAHGVTGAKEGGNPAGGFAWLLLVAGDRINFVWPFTPLRERP